MGGKVWAWPRGGAGWARRGHEGAGTHVRPRSASKEQGAAGGADMGVGVGVAWELTWPQARRARVTMGRIFFF